MASLSATPRRRCSAVERNATGLIRTGTQWTKRLGQIIDNRVNMRNFRTPKDGLEPTQQAQSD